jgi:glycosyltransferase involved in cell wall biosynthesis
VAPDTGTGGPPLVDIGIPVFRRADWVATAIESVIEQSYDHWQLTISEDGGPTDAIARAVEPYLVDERIHYSTPEQHLGLARHKSSLAGKGDGKYVAVLDDDDVWMSGWLARRVGFLEEHAECGLVWGGHVDIGLDGKEIRSAPFPFTEGVHSSLDFVRAMMQRNLVVTPDVLVRREAYVRAGNTYDASFAHINDYELWLRLGTLGPVGFLEVRDCGVRIHPQRMSMQQDRASDHLRLIDHLDALLQKNLPELRLTASVRRRQKADRVVSTALDAISQNEARRAAGRIVSAARLDPRALASRRAAAAIVAIVGGKRVRQRIGAMRP